jgi:2-methylcitrate dehydratase
MIARLEIVHGGDQYDRNYPEGIPTSVTIEHSEWGVHDSGLVMFPLGHARSDQLATAALLDLKFERLVSSAVADPVALKHQVSLHGRSPEDVAWLYAFPIEGVTGE